MGLGVAYSGISSLDGNIYLHYLGYFFATKDDAIDMNHNNGTLCWRFGGEFWGSYYRLYQGINCEVVNGPLTTQYESLAT